MHAQSRDQCRISFVISAWSAIWSVHDPPQEFENNDPDFIEEEIDDIDSHKNNTVIDIFDDFDDDELDEIANEYSLSNGPKSKLRKKKSSDASKEEKKDKKEEKLDKGQTTLFSF